MKHKQKVINKIRKKSKKFAFSSFSKNLTRLGYCARGLIYAIIGLLAIKVAFGASANLSDQQGAIASIGHQLFGRILLGIILIGLVGYALWGLIRVLFDPLKKGKDLKGILQRIGFFFSAVAYAILIPPTYNFIFNISNAAQNGVQGIQIKNIISTIFLVPFGKWIVGVIGLIVIGVGLFEIYRVVKENFDKQLKPYKLTFKQVKIIKAIGRFGTLARAAVSIVIGIFLLFAAYQANSSGVKGIDGALLILLQQPYGSWLLGIVAFGLISFGFYSFLSGVWFKFKK